jgi:uncharacterized protein
MKGFLYIGVRLASLLRVVLPLLAGAALLLALLFLAKAEPQHRRSFFQVSLGLAGFCLLDAGLVAALPRLRLSFGPPEFSVSFLIFLRVVLFLIWVGVFASSVRFSGAPASGLFYWLINTVLTLLVFYAFYIEPFHLQVTRLEVPVQATQLQRSLRIVQLSDPHVERTTRREREIVRRVRALKPDVIVLTGDYVNLSYLADRQAIEDARDFLSRFDAPLGIFAVNGSVDDQQQMDRLFSGTNVTVLKDRAYPLSLPGGQVTLIGLVDVDESRDPTTLRRLVGEIPPGRFTLLLYHPPDLVYEASKLGVNLYLCGHTHGGQIRLPVYGAVVTASAFGKQFEAGRYQLGSTTLYVSRGLGMEGNFAPRARFLAPPEIVVVDLIPAPAAVPPG